MRVIAWLLLSRAIIIGSAGRVELDLEHVEMQDQLDAEKVTQMENQLDAEEAMHGETDLSEEDQLDAEKAVHDESDLSEEVRYEAELSQDATKTGDYSVACYCKTVDGQDQCLDNKYRNDNYKPNGPRYFHEGVPGDKDGEVKNICCKTDFTSIFTFVGWSYSKMADKYCDSETRHVPETSCCLLKDKHGSFGVRVSKVKSLAYNSRAGTEYGQYQKSPPRFDLNDITGAEDFTGAQVPLEDVHGFITMQLDAGRFDKTLQCGGTYGTIDKLFDNKESKCQLRAGSSQQCCCHTATLIEAIRCLPAEGAANEQEAAVHVLPSKVEIFAKNGYKQHVVSHQYAPDEGRMQGLILDTVDPDQEDLPETAADETEMKWSWTKETGQWSSRCSKEESLPSVRSHRKSKTVADGRSCSRVRIGRAYTQRCRTKYKRVYYMVYSQGYDTTCVEYTWTRKCPAGQGLFEKVIQKGGCFTEFDKLERLGSLMFQCPKDYESGNGGTAKHNRLCKCEQKCE